MNNYRKGLYNKIMNTNKEYSLVDRARMRHLASAALRRATDARIPDDYMRIGMNEFSKLLCKPYYANQGVSADSIAKRIFETPESIFRKPFILIDGGTKEERKRAGFAILFRLITCDKSGHHSDCTELIHKLQNMNMVHGITREERADALKSKDVIFVSDFRPAPVRSYSEGCLYLDEILEHRLNYRKPSIISFYTPLTAMRTIISAGVNDGGLFGIHIEEFVDQTKQNVYENETSLRIHVGID